MNTFQKLIHWMNYLDEFYVRGGAMVSYPLRNTPLTFEEWQQK